MLKLNFVLSGLFVVPCLVLAPVAATHSEEASVEVKVSKKDCRRLVRHRPSNDVNYKPGVDVYGRAIAPADLPGSATFKTPNEITISLTMDVLEKFGVDSDSALGSLSGETSFGEIKYNISSGKMTLDGKPLGDREVEALATACESLN